MGDRGEQTPEVDVIIPVHSEMRPVRRAAASVLEHTEAAVRVTVIAHNIEKDIIVRNLGDVAADRRVRVLNLDDGIRSPAGPMNAGLDHVTAPFFAVLGSDDEFAPGAIDAWLGLQRATNASVVLAAIDLVSGRRDPFPRSAGDDGADDWMRDGTGCTTAARRSACCAPRRTGACGSPRGSPPGRTWPTPARSG